VRRTRSKLQEKELPMAVNLVSLVTQFLTPDVIAKIASALGIDRALAQKAVGGAVPAILSGLAGVASTPGGVRQLSNVLAQQQPGMLDNLKNLVGDSGQKGFADAGTSMLSGLLGGDTLAAVTQSVGNFANIGEGASKSLLGMLGPVVMGALGQQQRTAGLDATGLASLLTSQKDQIASAIPSGLADRLDAAGLVDRLSDGVRGNVAAASAAAGRFGDAAERAVAGSSQATYAAGNQAVQAARSASFGQWPYLVIGLLILGGLVWYFSGGSTGDKVAQQARPVATQPAKPVETVGAAPPNLTVAGVDLRNRFNSSVDILKTTLTGITDATTAQAALPKLREAVTQIDELNALSAKLSQPGRGALASLIAAAMPTINQLCDKVLNNPGVGAIAKPTIDELRTKLDALAKA
jgi:hypothetical protein